MSWLGKYIAPQDPTSVAPSGFVIGERLSRASSWQFLSPEYATRYAAFVRSQGPFVPELHALLVLTVVSTAFSDLGPTTFTGPAFAYAEFYREVDPPIDRQKLEGAIVARRGKARWGKKNDKD